MKSITKILGIGVTFMLLSFTSINENTTNNAIEEEVEYACAPAYLSCMTGEVCGISAEQMATQVAYAEEYWCGD